jgi:hypothetical protein
MQSEGKHKWRSTFRNPSSTIFRRIEATVAPSPTALRTRQLSRTKARLTVAKTLFASGRRRLRRNTVTRWGNCLVVIVLDGHVVCPAGSSLTPRATILSDPSESGRCSFKTSSGGAVIQASTSSGVVRITGIAFGWIAPTSAFGSVVRNAYRSLVVSPSLTFRTDVQLVAVRLHSKQFLEVDRLALLAAFRLVFWWRPSTPLMTMACRASAMPPRNRTPAAS